MIIAVTSWRGWGASTLALAIARHLSSHGEDAWLIEADPAGGVLAGRVTLDRTTVGGLERVAFPPERRAPVELLHEVAHHAGSLHIVTAPLDPFGAGLCHRPRLQWQDALAELPGTVVVDIGRWRANSAAWPLLQVADEIVCVLAPEVGASVATREWQQADGRSAPGEVGVPADRLRLAVVDVPGGVAFPRAALLADLGAECIGWLPWDASDVAAVHRLREPLARRAMRNSYTAEVGRLVARLGSQLGTETMELVTS